MIRGPVLPLARERLWSIVQRRLDVVESGLELVLEALDCSAGQHGPVDGLCRDAGGAPVLVALALDDDALLLPRLVAAADFLERVGPALAEAVPEGSFCSGARPRLLVLGTESSAVALERLRHLDVPELELVRLESFRLGGSERFAVRRLEAAPARTGAAAEAEPAAAAAFAADDSLWQAVVRLCERLDGGVRIDGDRFRRRISWRGRLLGQVVSTDGAMRATVVGGAEQEILGKADVRAFGDRLMRRYAELAGLRPAAADRGEAGGEACEAPSRELRPAARAPAPTTLRSAMAEALLSPEEFAALAEPADVGRPTDCPD